VRQVFHLHALYVTSLQISDLSPPHCALAPYLSAVTRGMAVLSVDREGSRRDHAGRERATGTSAPRGPRGPGLSDFPAENPGNLIVIN
jgi:hypothetical protein